VLKALDSFAKGRHHPASFTLEGRLPAHFEIDLPVNNDGSAALLQSFEHELRAPSGACLLGVDLSESFLTKMGYFI